MKAKDLLKILSGLSEEQLERVVAAEYDTSSTRQANLVTNACLIDIEEHKVFLIKYR